LLDCHALIGFWFRFRKHPKIIPHGQGLDFGGQGWSGDLLGIGASGGGEAGRGQFCDLGGGRIVRQALDDFGQEKFACAGT
jgi:hypothetical protein